MEIVEESKVIERRRKDLVWLDGLWKSLSRIDRRLISTNMVNDSCPRNLANGQAQVHGVCPVCQDHGIFFRIFSRNPNSPYDVSTGIKCSGWRECFTRFPAVTKKQVLDHMNAREEPSPFISMTDSPGRLVNFRRQQVGSDKSGYHQCYKDGANRHQTCSEHAVGGRVRLRFQKQCRARRGEIPEFCSLACSVLDTGGVYREGHGMGEFHESVSQRKNRRWFAKPRNIHIENLLRPRQISTRLTDRHTIESCLGKVCCRRPSCHVAASKGRRQARRS